MSYTATTLYKRHCYDKNKWCEYANEIGYCSQTACVKSDYIKNYQIKIGAIADGVCGQETLRKSSKTWKWSGEFINNMEDVAIEMLLATGWLYKHDKEISRGQGHWNHEVWEAPLSDSTMNVYKCSECGLHYQSESNFCPNCGADMRDNNKGGDLISRANLIAQLHDGFIKTDRFDKANQIILDALSAEQGWIPFTRRPMTEEEQKDYPNCTFMFDCVLPEDGDEILVSNGRFVWMDTFCNDIDGCYLDGGDDINEDMAWMPLPKPYKGGDE